MTWRTEIGERTLMGAEAALFRESLGNVVDMVEAEIAGDSDPWEFGVPVFDQLAAQAKLALLAEVGWALLRDTDACPKLTAINEAAVAILFANIEHSLHFEVDAQKDGYEDSLFWRPLVLAVFREIGDTIDLPDLDCTDTEDWNLLVDAIDGAPECPMGNASEILVIYFPHQQRSEWPTADQRIHEQNDFVGRPDIGPLQFGNHDCRAIFRASAVQHFVQTFRLRFVNVGHTFLVEFACAQAGDLTRDGILDGEVPPCPDEIGDDLQVVRGHVY